jgi:hypothetical protein
MTTVNQFYRLAEIMDICQIDKQKAGVLVIINIVLNLLFLNV